VSRTRVSAGFFGGEGTSPGKTYGKVSRINLGAFGPGEDQKKARALYDANEARIAGETSNGLGRNIATAGDVAHQRRTDTLTGQAQSRLIGGPAPDSAWDAFFGSLQRKEGAANDAGLKFNARPAIQNLGRPNRTAAFEGLQHAAGFTRPQQADAMFGDPRAQQQADARYSNFLNPNTPKRRY
jgi:hypothetical protein